MVAVAFRDRDLDGGNTKVNLNYQPFQCKFIFPLSYIRREWAKCLLSKQSSILAHGARKSHQNAKPPHSHRRLEIMEPRSITDIV